MNNANDNEVITDIKRELYNTWLILFVIQLIVGSHAIYELADKYPDIGFIQYVCILSIGAAVIAAILLAILVVLFFIAAGIFIGIGVFREHRRSRRNDAS